MLSGPNSRNRLTTPWRRPTSTDATSITVTMPAMMPRTVSRERNLWARMLASAKPMFSILKQDCRTLCLRPERFHGLHPRGQVRGVETRRKTHGYGEAYGQQNVSEGHADCCAQGPAHGDRSRI